MKIKLMKIIHSQTTETEEEFIQRFMADEKMVVEYPDEEQRT